MTRYHSTLLAAVAALALAAGTGLAAAQTMSPGGEHGKANERHATPSSQSAGSQGAMSRESREGREAQQPTGEETNPSKHGAADKGEHGSKSTAQRDQRLKGLQGNAAGEGQQGASAGETEPGQHNGNRSAEHRGKHNRSTAQQEHKLKGLHGQVNQPKAGSNAQNNGTSRPNNGGPNATQNGRDSGRPGGSMNARENNEGGTTPNETARSGEARGSGRVEGADITLNDQQRSEIRKTVIEGRSAPRVSHVDFDVRIGTVVPRRRIHLIRVPETLVRIEPRWRGYEYFVFEDEVVIVDPHDLKIVAIIPV